MDLTKEEMRQISAFALLLVCFLLILANATQLKIRKHRLQTDQRNSLKLQKQRQQLDKGSADFFDYLGKHSQICDFICYFRHYLCYRHFIGDST